MDADLAVDDIDARFNAEDHARFEQHFITFCYEGGLVNADAYTMSQADVKIFPALPVLNDLSCGVIDILCKDMPAHYDFTNLSSEREARRTIPFFSNNIIEYKFINSTTSIQYIL